MDINQLTNKIQDLREKAAKLRNDAVSASDALSSYSKNNELSRAQTELQNITRWNDEAQKLEEEAMRLDQEVQIMHGQVAGLDNKEKDLTSQIQNVENQLAALRREQEDIQAQKKRLVGVVSTSFF